MEVSLEVYQMTLIKNCLETLKIIHKNLFIDGKGLEIICCELIEIALNFIPELLLKNGMLYKKIDKSSIYCTITTKTTNAGEFNVQVQSNIKNLCKKQKTESMKAILMDTNNCLLICYKNDNESFSISKPIKYIGINDDFLYEFLNWNGFFRSLIGFLRV